ncbi:hypothetical protein OIDMADRAFT_52471 [Oidiodendron maius Zn]|uniref:Cell wall protein n=1 Tax=Oidiodendron maius (strain Zn) TaxID=913774 RepID=A0A0C3HHS7_OIDMZ|nr:hypothetical protein OIDMADRAFT_52471 [Oidiodendron maius Zn]
MKFFALLPLATLFMGALSSPTISVALQERESADPLSTLQQFTADSKQYTDAIHTAITPLTPSSDPASLSEAAETIANAIQGLEELVTNTTAVLTGNEKITRTVTLRSGNPLDSSAASQIAEFLADLSSLSWNLQDLFGFSGPIGEALGPLISSVTQLWATVLAL